jgi:hypothetical protein
MIRMKLPFRRFRRQVFNASGLRVDPKQDIPLPLGSGGLVNDVFGCDDVCEQEAVGFNKHHEAGPVGAKIAFASYAVVADEDDDLPKEIGDQHLVPASLPNPIGNEFQLAHLRSPL